MVDNRDFTSAYNEGMLQIERLHYLWAQANNQSRAGKYKEWRWTLDTIWRELSRDAIKKEFDKLQPGEFRKVVNDSKWFKEHDELNKAINESVLKGINSEGLQAQYNTLSDMEIFLRGLQDAVGKGGKYKDEDEDSMD